MKQENIISSKRKLMKKRLRALFRRKIVIVAAIGVLLFIFAAIFAPFLTPYNPNRTSFRESLLGPSAKHLLGTDFGGRDVFTRILYGARVSLVIGVLSVLLAAIIGSLLGLLCAYYGGALDNIVMRVIEGMDAIPQIMISMALLAVFGTGFINLAIILGITTIPADIRMMRASALTIKNSDYMLAARLQGGSPLWQMVKHMFPNSLSPLIVMITQQVGGTIVVESGLSFMGIGISVPTASWGTMLSEGRSYLLTNPVYALSPGLAIALLIICLNLFGDGVRDALDPRLRGDV